jgi:uncharacterized iron-regulated membrane protein
VLRQLHRWTSLPLILFLTLVLGTGVLLQFEEIGKQGESGGPPAASTSMASDDTIAAQLAKALAEARAGNPDFKPSRVELNIAEGRQSTRLAMQPRGGPFVEIDHVTGKVKAEMKPEMPMHVLLIRLHTGAMMGATGVWIMLVASFILLFLAISGSVLYWQMWRNRAKAGRGRVFWK